MTQTSLPTGSSPLFPLYLLLSASRHRKSSWESVSVSGCRSTTGIIRSPSLPFCPTWANEHLCSLMHSDSFGPLWGQAPVKIWQLFPNLSKLRQVTHGGLISRGARSLTAVPALTLRPRQSLPSSYRSCRPVRPHFTQTSGSDSITEPLS